MATLSFHVIAHASTAALTAVGAQLSVLGHQLHNMGSSAGGALSSGLTSAMSNLPVVGGLFTNPYVAAAGAAIGAGLATAAGAALAAAVPLALGGGVLAAGILMAVHDPAVSGAFKKMADTAKASMAGFAEPFKGPLTRAAQTFSAAIVSMAPALKQMGATVAPIVDMLAPALAKMAQNMLPGIQKAVQASVPLFQALANHLPEIGTALSRMFTMIAEGLPGAITFFNHFLTVVQAVFIAVGWLIRDLSLKYQLLTNAVIAAKNGIVSAWGSLVAWFTNTSHTLSTSVINAWNGMLAWFSALPGRILGFLKAIPAMLGNLFRNALMLAATAVGTGVGMIVNFWMQLPGRIAAIASATWNTARSLFSAGVSAVVGFVSQLPGRVSSFVSQLPGIVGRFISSAWSNGRNTTASGISSMLSVVASLPGRMWSLGSAAVQGLINGIKSAAGALAGLASSMAHNFLGGFKNALGIHSPSRVFEFEVAPNIAAGLIQGIEGAQNAVGAAARGLAATTLQPFGSGSREVLSPRAGYATDTSAAPTTRTVTFAGNTDSAFATYVMKLIREKKIQIA